MTKPLQAKIRKIDVFPLNIPLSEPFVISLETITHAENILVRITAGNNFNEGTWSEFARAHKLVFAAGAGRIGANGRPDAPPNTL